MFFACIMYVLNFQGIKFVHAVKLTWVYVFEYYVVAWIVWQHGDFSIHGTSGKWDLINLIGACTLQVAHGILYS
jgi:hypothetical protein